MIKVQVYKDEAIVTVSMVVKGEVIANAEMDWLGDKWWLSRVLVKESFRRRGLGRKLIEKLKGCSRGKLIEVMPGGYNMKREDQFNFYERCGFKKLDENTLIWQKTR